MMTHTHSQGFPLPKSHFSLSLLTNLLDGWEKKQGSCITPGDAANCGLFTVCCPSGTQSLDQNECSHC